MSARCRPELRTTGGGRARAAAPLLRTWPADALPHFTVDRRGSDAAARRVAEVTRAAIPTWRSRTTAAGAISRPAGSIAAGRPRAARAATRRSARAWIDLTVVSVLLDAGAGPDWRYDEPTTGRALHPVRGPWRRQLPRLRRPGLFSGDPRRSVAGRRVGRLIAVVTDDAGWRRSVVRSRRDNPLARHRVARRRRDCCGRLGNRLGTSGAHGRSYGLLDGPAVARRRSVA